MDGRDQSDVRGRPGPRLALHRRQRGRQAALRHRLLPRLSARWEGASGRQPALHPRRRHHRQFDSSPSPFPQFFFVFTINTCFSSVGSSNGVFGRVMAIPDITLWLFDEDDIDMRNGRCFDIELRSSLIPFYVCCLTVSLLLPVMRSGSGSGSGRETSILAIFNGYGRKCFHEYVARWLLIDSFFWIPEVSSLMQSLASLCSSLFM